MNKQDEQAWLDKMANKKLKWYTSTGFLVPDPKSLKDGYFSHRYMSPDCSVDNGKDYHGSIGDSNWHVIGDYEDPILTTEDQLPILTY